jgi:hypothetical protein
MTTLHLDLEAAQHAIDAMLEAYKDIQALQKENRRMLVTDLYEASTWLGKSAKDFYDTYRDLDYQCYLQMEEYGKLITALVQEVKTWQAGALHLHYNPKNLAPPGVYRV